MIDVNLCSGGGGLAVGLQLAGFGSLHLYEKDARACETLRHNFESEGSSFRGVVVEKDVKTVEWTSLGEEVRLLAAGAPCQPFSLGGKHRASEDGRNLFPEVFRAVRELSPVAVLIENVRGLLRDGFQNYFEYILRQLECPSIGPAAAELWQTHNRRIRRKQCSVGYTPEYNVTWRLMNAADYGVPQNRFRVFIVATRRGLPPYTFIPPSHGQIHLRSAQEGGEYWRKHGLRRSLLSRNGRTSLSTCTKAPWVTVRDAICDLPKAALEEQGAWMNHWSVPGARKYAGHSGSELDWPSKTVKAGVHGVPGGENTVVGDDGRIRYFTFRELARLQSFPDSYLFCGARIHITRQIGNAVPPMLAKSVAEPLYRLLSDFFTQKVIAHATSNPSAKI